MPVVTIATVVTRDDVVAWAATSLRLPDAQQRVVAGPAAFMVYPHVVDPGFGAGSIVVRMRTGGFWHVNGDPDAQHLHMAKNDRRLRRALRGCGLDADRPDGVVPPAPHEHGVSAADVVAWAAGRYGQANAARRVADVGYAFQVSTQDDAVLEGRAPQTYGGLTVLVLKRTGEYWSVGSFPDAQPLLGAVSEAEMRDRMPQAHHDPARPEGVVGRGGEDVVLRRWWPFPSRHAPSASPPQAPAAGQLAEADVVAWAGSRYGQANAWRRVSDAGCAFHVSTQDDAVLEGRAMATAGALTIVVLKRTGEYWSVGSFPDAQPVFTATSEAELRDRLPLAHLDPARPEGRLGGQELPPPSPAQQPETAWGPAGGEMSILPVDNATGAGNPVSPYGDFGPSPGRAIAPPQYDHSPPQYDHPVPHYVEPGASGDPVTLEQLAAYLRATRTWQHIEDRIADLGWAFAVNPQPDAAIEGDMRAVMYGIGPLLVVKRDGGLWALPSGQPGLPASEEEFTRGLASYQQKPDEWVRR